MVKKGRIRKNSNKKSSNKYRRAKRSSHGRKGARGAKARARVRAAVRAAKVAKVVKKPVVLASAEPKGHSMHRNSGLILYWLTLLALVILNMLIATVVAILQLATGPKQFFFVVAALGLFFGYLTHRLINLVENLEARHHFFAWLLVPAAAMLNLFVISSAASALSSATGLGGGLGGFGHKYNPLLVSLSYGVAFIIPLLASFAAQFAPKAFAVFSSTATFPASRRRKNRLGKAVMAKKPKQQPL